MRLVLDASVAIAATRPGEPAHASARACVERALRGQDALVVPCIFPVEVSGALARQGRAEPDIRAFVEGLTRPGHEVVTIGPRRARAASRIAVACKLRGPGAVYVWLAAREAVPLCTLGQEILARASALCRVFAP
jgi:predicted nucleic acid-binding protein